MTPREVQTAVFALRAEVGPMADVSADISVYKSDLPCTGSIWPRGITKGCAVRVDAETWEDLLKKMRAGWAEYHKKHEAALIREMALEIIRVTAEYGSCTDASLRGNKFTSEEVKQFGARACVEADSMAANGPFAIVPLENSNAA